MHPPPSVRDSLPGGGTTPAPGVRGGFLLATCQAGAEDALCARQHAVLPQASKAAWRRGLVTFRLTGFDPPDDFSPDLVYARALLRSLGQVAAPSLEERVAALRELVAHPSWDNVHVWCRDPRTEADPVAVREALLAAHGLPVALPATASAGDLVLDCVIDSPERWWVGWHRAGADARRHAGGMHPVALAADKVSRAWLKLDEAIAAFGIAFAPGERACELGAAPGGSCQRLLEAGLEVVGIDPAVIDPRVADHPRFTHWRKRSRDVRLREFRGFDWVVSDMNIDPVSTLAAIGRIVAEAGVRPRGIVATLKLPSWSRAEALPEWLTTFREWGYVPQVRQLSTGGREVCCLAVRAGRGISRPRTTRRPGR